MRFDPRIARSWLFVPGDSPRKIEKSWSSGADAIIFDLEDAVAPDRKHEARRITREAIAAAFSRPPRTLVVIRVNSRDTGLTDDDIAETFAARPDAYMLPKVMTARDIVATASCIDQFESRGSDERSGPARRTLLIPIVTEAPAPLFRLPELCAAHSRNSAILWGSEDLAASMGARRVKDEQGRMLEVFRTVRSLALLAGSGAGLGIIDAPVIRLEDHEELRREAREACWMGFTGKAAIHPAQVPVINAAFTPDDTELALARAIEEGARESGGAAYRLGGRLVDLPHIRSAQRLIALYNALNSGPDPADRDPDRS